MVKRNFYLIRKNNLVLIIFIFLYINIYLANTAPNNNPNNIRPSDIKAG